jgi:hypothetical protein
LARTAIAARTTSTVSGAPPPPAWLRTSRHWWSPGSHAGVRAVQRLVAVEQLAHELRGRGVALARLRRQLGVGAGAGDRDHAGRRERPAVEHDHGLHHAQHDAAEYSPAAWSS